MRHKPSDAFFEFVRAVRPDFLVGAVHVRVMDVVLAGGNVAAAIPPRWGASTLLAQLYPAWVLGTEQGATVGVVTGYDDVHALTIEPLKRLIDSDAYRVWLREGVSGSAPTTDGLLKRVYFGAKKVREVLPTYVVVDTAGQKGSDVALNVALIAGAGVPMVVCHPRGDARAMGGIEAITVAMIHWSGAGVSYVYIACKAMVDGQSTFPQLVPTAFLEEVRLGMGGEKWAMEYQQEAHALSD